MEVKFSDPTSTAETRTEWFGKDRVRVKRETLLAALEQCQRALESLNTTSVVDEDEKDSGVDVESTGSYEDRCPEGSSSTRDDRDADELHDLLKSGFESPAFLEKLQRAQASNSRITTEEGNSWDMVSENDLWKGEDIESDQDCYVLVRQEDIAEGMACFMAAYLLSLDNTKDLTPNRLQKVLSKTFSMKKKKGKLQKAWDGSKVIYNVASWGATAIGIYQNPVIIRAATKAFWTSCQVISKLL